MEEFQKQGRALRKRPRNKVEIIHLVELSKRGGAHDDKGGDHAKRAKRRKEADREIKNQLREFNEDFWKKLFTPLISWYIIVS